MTGSLKGEGTRWSSGGGGANANDQDGDVDDYCGGGAIPKFETGTSSVRGKTNELVISNKDNVNRDKYNGGKQRQLMPLFLLIDDSRKCQNNNSSAKQDSLLSNNTGISFSSTDDNAGM